MARWEGRAVFGGAIAMAALAAGLAGCSRSASNDTAPKKKDPTVEAAIKRGDEALAKGDKKKAAAAYGEAIRLDPKHSGAYVKRGMVLNESGDPKKAFDDFCKAIDLDPRNDYAYDQRAAIYQRVFKDQAKATADKEKAFALREKQRDKIRDDRKKKMDAEAKKKN